MRCPLSRYSYSPGQSICVFCISCIAIEFVFQWLILDEIYSIFAFTGVKLNYFEMIFVQFLHLLARHPDFALTQDSVPDMAKYARLRTLPHAHTSDIMAPDISTSTLDR